jgi:hypothetical protein
MRAHGRAFQSALSPGATRKELETAEDLLGFPLSRLLRAFLTEWNGIELTSYASPGEHHEVLIVENVDTLVTSSNRANNFLREASRTLNVKPASVLLPSGYLDGQIVLRMDECDNHRGVEPPARLQWEPGEDSWPQIAASFEDWLLRSLTSMAETAGGFLYFAPTRMW